MNLTLSPEQLQQVRNPYFDVNDLSYSSEMTPMVAADSMSDWREVNDLSSEGDTLSVKRNAHTFVPVAVDGGDAPLIMGALGATVLAFATEREMLEFVQKNDGRVADKLASFAEPFGGDKAGWAVTGGLIYGMVVKDQEVKSFTRLMFEATLATKLVNDSFKLLTARALPGDSHDPFHRSDETNPSRLAFPSGHASTVFSIATVIAETYKGRNSYIPVLAYGTAALTSWSRVYDNQHWVSDVIVGGLLGHLVAKAVIHRNQARSGLYIFPYISRYSAGVQLIYSKRSAPLPCPREGRYRKSIERCLQQAFAEM